MTRKEIREERERRRQEKIGETLVGVCAIMGAIWLLCAFAGLVLRGLGVQ